MYQVLLYLFFCYITIESAVLKQAQDNKQPFELNEYLRGTFATRSFNGSWISGSSFLYRNSEANYVIYNANSQETEPFFNRTVLDNYPGASVSISNDQQYLLLRYNVNAVFRHSTTAQYAVYDLNNNAYYDIADKQQVQIVQWAPVGHSLAFVYSNNIYYLPSPEQLPLPLTADGVSGIIYNGVPDWVYEEEVLGSGLALWFSPDASKLAFASFNDTYVEEFDYFLYGTPGSVNNLYPETARIRYPKVGTANPIVRTFVVDLSSVQPAVEVLGIPNRFWPYNNVLYDITWITNDELAVISSNRVQNEAELSRCYTATGECVKEKEYKEDKGWLDIRIPKYNKDGSKRLEILPQPEADDFFDHLVLTDVGTDIATRLTNGRFVVTTILGWDEENNLIYFDGSGLNAPTQKQVYVVSTETLQTDCLTCELETPSGLCLYASASLSKDFSNVVLICQGPGPYFVQVQKTREPTDVVVWEDNQSLRDRLAVKAFPIVKNLTVPLENGFEALVRLFLPPDLDESDASKKYPAIVYVYAGPDSNQITDSYSTGLQLYLTTNRKYIYILIDGRGSGRDGQNKKFTVYRNLATVEIEDQIAVTKYLQENYPYIDAKNTGIWGWSYGGFATAWALVKDKENVFKFGLSVAPVTSFIYYDTIYTERYMGLLDDNEAGYNNTDVSRNVEAIRGKLFLLIHGNADDNVHYQQSMLLSRALELADIAFQQQSYPDENHSLGGVSPHLYHTIDRFWARSLGLPDPPAPRLPKEEDKNDNQ